MNFPTYIPIYTHIQVHTHLYLNIYPCPPSFTHTPKTHTHKKHVHTNHIHHALRTSNTQTNRYAHTRTHTHTLSASTQAPARERQHEPQAPPLSHTLSCTSSLAPASISLATVSVSPLLIANNSAVYPCCRGSRQEDEHQTLCH